MAVKFDVILGELREQDTFGGSMSSDLDMNLYQILEFRIENVGSLPAGGNKGRLVYLTTNDNIYLDTG